MPQNTANTKIHALIEKVPATLVNFLKKPIIKWNVYMLSFDQCKFHVCMSLKSVLARVCVCVCVLCMHMCLDSFRKTFHREERSLTSYFTSEQFEFFSATIMYSSFNLEC